MMDKDWSVISLITPRHSNRSLHKCRRAFRLVSTVACTWALVACQQSVPKEALQLSPDSLERRQTQTRVFETGDEAQLLSASAALLQDLGFTLDESEVDLGVLVASKDRDATEAGQVVGAVAMAILFGAYVPVDDQQKIRAALVTRKLEDRHGYAVRLTMQRIVWNTDGKVSKTEPLDDALMYQEFFDKLSKSVFLEAQEL
jgi:hypothetical protein